MPPKTKFSKEKIVEAAFEIAKSEGIDSITIRKVADKLGSSIAPIYVNFETVEELIQEVVKRIFELSREILAEQNSGNPFQDIGMASLQFAKDYSVLFRDLIMNQNKYMDNYDQDLGDELVQHMQEDPELSGFSSDEIRMIFFKMRVFQMGLSVMVANGFLPPEFGEEQMIETLNSMATDIVIATRIKQEEESD